MKESTSKLRADLMANAMAYNNCLTKEHLNPKSIQELYYLSHPSERLVFAQRIRTDCGIVVKNTTSEHDS